MTPIRPGERGAALLAVLILVAITGAIAAASLEKVRLSRLLSTNVAAMDQARHFAAGAEELAALIVDDLVALDRQRTTLAGGWNGAVRRLPMPGGGMVEARLRDGGNCFNINSVVQGSVATGLSRRPSGVAQFIGLMVVRGVPEPEAVRIAEAAADWADSDGDTSPGGAEDAAYAAGAQPYRTANTLFSDVSELRAVQGMRPAIYDRIRPFLCVLPVPDLSPINVNTLMPGQAALLAMLAPRQLDENLARRVLAMRPRDGWRTSTEFWRIDVIARLNVGMDVRLQPQLRTDWFLIDIRSTMLDVEHHETALVDARIAPARVVQRRWERDPALVTLAAGAP